MSTLDEALTLGPFTGGLNTRSIPDLLEDNELAYCMNFDVELDGSLKTRPPITTVATPNASDLFHIIGTGKIAGTTYIFGTNSAGTYVSSNQGSSWSLVTANVANAVVFYNDLAYLIPNATGQGGYYNGSTFTSDASMPTGKAALAFKSRIWVARGSTSSDYTRIQFTDPITAATLVWTASNIIDVNAKDGETIQGLLIYNDDLMIFKDDSTWLYAFDLLPEDGVIRQVNEKIGINNPYCFGVYQNVVYLLHEEQVYELNGYNFTQINIKVPFTAVDAYGHSASHRFALSIIDNRVVVKFYDNIYVLNILNNAWSQWGGANMSKRSKFWEVDSSPSTGYELLGKYYLAGSSVAGDGTIFKLQDGANISEDVNATIITKVYDFDEPLMFKRMMWWAVHLSASPSVATDWDFQVFPEKSASILQTIAVGGNSNDYENAIKIKDAVRFRKIYFYISAYSGSGVQDRSHLRAISAILKPRQTVAKQENV